MLAASESDMDIHYYTFGDAKFASALQLLLVALSEHQVSVGGLFGMLLDYSRPGDAEQESKATTASLFDFICESLSSSK